VVVRGGRLIAGRQMLGVVCVFAKALRRLCTMGAQLQPYCQQYCAIHNPFKYSVSLNLYLISEGAAGSCI
jgi:hypothetical protein